MHGDVQRTAEIERQLGALREVAAGNRIRHIWSFDPTQRTDDAPFPNRPVIAAPHNTFYLSPFADGRLAYWDEVEQRLRPGSRDVHLFLDSNMLAVLIPVMLDGNRDADNMEVMLDLIQHREAWRADLQALPYLREIALRTTIISTQRYAVRAIEALLRFQGIDVATSIAAETIVPDAGFPERMAATFGSNDYPKAAELIFADMAAKDHGFPGDMISTYAFFLHMIDTSIRRRNDTIEQQLAAADDFIYNTLINAQPRLHVLARYFFARKLEALIKAQPGNPNFTRTGLRGAIYDLNLASLHEQFLGGSKPPTADLSVLCTRDVPLAHFAPRFLVRTLGVIEEAHGTSYRMITPWDDDGIKADIGDALWESASEAAANRDVARMQGEDDPTRIIAAMRELEDRLNITVADRLVPQGQENRVAWVVNIDDP